jgi:hypothetical protein
MHKKLMLSYMSLVALAAFALPASAQAENKPTLKDKGGILPAGTKIVGTNVGEIKFWNTSTSTLAFSCTSAKLTGEVTKNKEDSVEAKITTADFSGTGAESPDNKLAECTSPTLGTIFLTFLPMPLILKSNLPMITDEFQLSGTGGNIRLLLGNTSFVECEYEATSTIQGDLTTNETQATLTTRDTAGSGLKLIRGSFVCPSSYVMAMTLTLETETGEPVWIVKTP